MITITTAQCVIANAAFAGLDGFQKPLGDKSIFVPYKFTDETRTKLRRLKRAIKAIADEFTESNQALVKELAPESQDISGESVSVRVEFFRRLKVLQDERHQIDLPKVKLNGELLSEGKNPIPDTVLDALDPITEDEPTSAPLSVIEGGES